MRVTSKGQVTIPKHVRDKAGIRPGVEVEFSMAGQDVVMRRRKARKGSDGSRDAALEAYFDEVDGMVDLGMTTDEFMQLMRGE